MQRLCEQDVGQSVARLDPWPARLFTYSSSWGLQRQAIIEEFTRSRVFTCDTLKPSILSIQVLPLSHLSFAYLACVHLILFVFRLFDAELTLTRQTRRTPALYCPKRVQIPRITIAAGCSRGVVAVYVSTFFLSLMSIAHLVRTQ